MKKILLYFSTFLIILLPILYVFTKNNGNIAYVEYDITIKDHKFEPSEIIVNSGSTFYINIHNQDNTSEEFDSIDLKREKIVPGNSKVRIKIGSLKPGEYKFIGEFHEDTAQGKVIVLPKKDSRE